MKANHLIPNHELDLNKLSDREFEKLLYRIFKDLIKRKDAFVENFTDVQLRSGVGERGRDCTLHNKNQTTGLIQCKKYDKNLSPKEVSQEIIKFSINAIIDKNLISDIKNFTYFFAVSKGFSDNSIDLISDFNQAILNQKDFEKWVLQVMKNNKAFQHLSYEEIENDLKDILQNIKIIPIIPTDINGWLSGSPIAKEFFTVPADFLPKQNLSLSKKIIFSIATLFLFLLGSYFTMNYTVESRNLENMLSNGMYSDSISKPTFERNDNYFKILLLPFNPDNNCTFQDTDYERQLTERFQTLKENNNLNLEVKLNQNYACPQTNKDAQKIGQNENADIVIWGHYDEKCEGNVKVRLRYTLVEEDYHLSEVKEGDSEMQTLVDLSELRRGFLQEDLDYIFEWSTAQIDFKNGDFDKGIERLLTLNKRYCDDYLLLEIAERYGEQKKYDEQLTYLFNIVNCTKKTLDYPYSLIGETYYAKNDTSNTLKYLELGLIYNSYISIFDFEKIMAVYNNWKKNNNDYELLSNRLIDKGLNKAVVLSSKGKFSLLKKDTINAVIYLTQSIKEDSSNYLAYEELANCIKLSDTSKAINLYKTFIKKNSNDDTWFSHAYNQLAFLHSDLDTSLLYINQAIKFDDSKSGFYFVNRANFYYNQGNYRKAIIDYSKNIELNDFISKYDYEKRIQTYIKLEMYDKAFEDYDNIFQLENISVYDYNEVFKLCKEIDDNERYKKYVIHFSKEFNHDENICKNLVSHYEYLNEKDSVNNYVQKLIDIYSEKIQTDTIVLAINYNQRGIYYNEIGEYDKAISDFETALETYPNDKTIKSNLAQTLKDKRFAEYPILKYLPTGNGFWVLLIILFSMRAYFVFTRGMAYKVWNFKRIINDNKLLIQKANISKISDKEKFFLKEFQRVRNHIIDDFRTNMVHGFTNFSFLLILGIQIFVMFSLQSYYSELIDDFDKLWIEPIWFISFSISPFLFLLFHLIISSIIKKRPAFIIYYTEVIEYFHNKYEEGAFIFLGIHLLIFFCVTKHIAIPIELLTNFQFNLDSSQWNFFDYILLIINSGYYLHYLGFKYTESYDIKV